VIVIVIVAEELGYGIWDMVDGWMGDVLFLLSRACIHTYTRTHTMAQSIVIL
jgi:hypothetical protein